MTKRHNYTVEQIDFLEKAYPYVSRRRLTVAFNVIFETDLIESQIKAALQNWDIRCGRGPIYECKFKIMSAEQAAWLRDNARGRSFRDLARLFNQTFGTTLTEKQVLLFCRNHRIRNGRNTRFKKGQKVWNNGTKGQGVCKPNKGSFKKGQVPPNRRPMYSERITKDGFVEIKIPERDPYTGFPVRWVCKHVWLWEQEHGPVPKGMCVSFVDGDKMNCVLENMHLISRAELVRLNQLGYKDAPSEIKPSLLALARLRNKVGVAKRKAQEASA